MAELALAHVDPGWKRRPVRLAFGRGKVAEAWVVERGHARGPGNVLTPAEGERPTLDETIEPQLDVLRQPVLADVLAILVVSQVEAAAQTAALVAEREVFLGRRWCGRVAR
jgi:hypothetical protein